MSEYPKSLAWADLWERIDPAACDVLIESPGYMYRGPLQAVKTNDERIVLVVEWLAQFMPPTNRWFIFREKGHEECELEIDTLMSRPNDFGLAVTVYEHPVQRIHIVPHTVYRLKREDVLIQD